MVYPFGDSTTATQPSLTLPNQIFNVVQLSQYIMVYIVLGVSGCGKTTIGKILAEKLSLEFHDADDYHTADNIEKMTNSIPLVDEDRIPWLTNLSRHITEWNMDKGAVLACSALKEQYRQILSRHGSENVVFIYLAGDRDTIIDRMKRRKGHFFPVSLVEDQFRELEPPLDAITIRIDKGPEEICAELVDECAKRGFNVSPEWKRE